MGSRQHVPGSHDTFLQDVCGQKDQKHGFHKRQQKTRRGIREQGCYKRHINRRLVQRTGFGLPVPSQLRVSLSWRHVGGLRIQHRGRLALELRHELLEEARGALRGPRQDQPLHREPGVSGTGLSMTFTNGEDTQVSLVKTVPFDEIGALLDLYLAYGHRVGRTVTVPKHMHGATPAVERRGYVSQGLAASVSFWRYKV